MTNIEEYITLKNETYNESVASVASETPKRRGSKPKDVILVDDHELIRKRDILASVALLDGLKNYIGENITAAQIRNMKKEKIESYFTLYKEKAGQEAVNDMMSSLVEILVKGLSFVTDIDNQEDLKNDLINNKQLRKILGNQAAEIAERYGDSVSILRVIFTIGKHITLPFNSPADASILPADASILPA